MLRRICSLILLFSFGVAAAVDTSVSVPMKATRVGTHSYYIQGLAGAASADNQGFMSNAGFVVTRKGVVVFDTLGTPPLAGKMLGIIRKITKQPVRIVIVSHYHADHYYGVQVFKEQGAEIWAHRNAEGQTRTENAALRLAQRKEVLFPWVNESTKLTEPDRFLEGDTDFELGGVHFNIRHVGPAHSDEDLAMLVREDRVLYAGDLVFKGRVPFVGEADSKAWLKSLDKLIALKPRVMVPGHGAASTMPLKDLTLTRDYLMFIRNEMAKAVDELIPFDEAYARTDWTRYQDLPAFEEANRPNAYNTYLLMEQEKLK
ncbi:MAG: MBL fold metallo-hydrolase [Hydrogenophilaceae bacterium]|nr:MBL fold metallo-hydrolase [Hydrogenophilaceae bacterium]